VANKILDIAHRGASGSQPENTKSAFLEARRVNADAIELDVHLTKDKKVVVIHDSSINRTSNGEGFVERMSLKELKRFNFGLGHQEEKILTLEEALTVIGNKCFVIVELKESIKGNEWYLLQIINKAKNKEKVWIHTSYKSIIRNIRKINSQIRVGYISIFSFTHHLLLPYYHWFSKKYNVSFFSIDELFLNKPFVKTFIKELNRMNLEVYVWTVNDLTTMYQALSWNANGIITNHPGILKNVIKKEQ
jgi:glycerophosphoryl diester phosphodiesterase